VKPIKLISLVVLFMITFGACNQNQDSNDLSKLEEDFRKSISGVTLVGHFTLGENSNLREEKYTIKKVSKISGSIWLFQVRIQYGSNDVTVPLPLNVKWAGDTPIITLTDLSIPGLGTYTARVLIYRDQYAGTWSAEEIKGQLFGRIVREQTSSNANSEN